MPPNRAEYKNGDRGEALVPRSPFLYSARFGGIAAGGERRAAGDDGEGPGAHRAAARHRRGARRCPHRARGGRPRRRPPSGPVTPWTILYKILRSRGARPVTPLDNFVQNSPQPGARPVTTPDNFVQNSPQPGGAVP